MLEPSRASVAAIGGVLAVGALGAWLVSSGPAGWWMFTPAAQAHQGIAEIARGRPVSGWMRQLIPLLWTVVLVGVVARVHYREMTTERRVFNRGAAERGSWRFRTPAQGVGRLFVSEILGSRWGRRQRGGGGCPAGHASARRFAAVCHRTRARAVAQRRHLAQPVRLGPEGRLHPLDRTDRARSGIGATPEA